MTARFGCAVDECGLPDFADWHGARGRAGGRTVKGVKRARRGAAAGPRCSDKDGADLEFVCDLGVDWLALSFVQRAAPDVTESRELARGRAAILSNIEKPAAVTAFDEILAVSDGDHGGAW